ncbi:MAG: RtcB family protein [Oligoflexia bacterium]|nr:RtcB family protein [Oligoflexia bacterium]
MAQSSGSIAGLPTEPRFDISRLTPITDTLWELPADAGRGMRVPARIFGTRHLLEQMDAAVFEQITNVATLPGIVRYACCMPDGHSGYGFPIGGVAAFDAANGVISPGGIGFDINCGMRLVVTSLTFDEVMPHLHSLVDRLYDRVPAGVGCAGLLRLSTEDLLEIAEKGALWCLENGYAWPEDLALTEDGGRSLGADSNQISPEAIARGRGQVGTLGSGNHYLEIQVARPENIHDPQVARNLGIDLPNQVVIMFHCGSRGFGHQVASDYLRLFIDVMERKYGIRVPDRELACAPFDSPEGQAYFSAMKCAINMSFVNRQVILHRIREVFSDEFHKAPEELGLRMVYDVAHNTAKLENHWIEGKQKKLVVHRKGATRSFGPEMPGLPERYRNLGQPVIIGGSMESGSYLMLGLSSAAPAFFSSAHGSGRTMSRTKAKRQFRGRQLADDMASRGIYVKSASYSGLAEEAGKAYKDIDEVASASEAAGLSRRIVKLVPIGNIKG